MMETSASGLHNAILFCVGAAAVYLVVAILQLSRLKRHPSVAIVRDEPSVGLQTMEHREHDRRNDATFADWLKSSNIDAQLQRVHRELERVHSELSLARTEIRQLRDERSVPSTVSFHGEALDFARRGMPAAAIASHCGISLGEAELVTALARTIKDDLPSTESKPVIPRHERYDGGYRAAA